MAARPALLPQVNPVRFSLILTILFFLVALYGLLHHEMWRDEHQAWLVARDAHSYAQVFDNLRYEGNPALWHSLLFVITRITSDPWGMQFIHLLIATGFIFLFTRYAPLSTFHKILFTFGYFPLYEYAVISRSYGLGILLVFIVCVLYKNRKANYLWMGLALALLANVTIYGAILSLAFAGILLLDYITEQEKSSRSTLFLASGGALFLLGFILSIYQILPEPDNSFPSPLAKELFDFPRWAFVGGKYFSAYFYIPEIQKNFWNTNIYTADSVNLGNGTFWEAITKHPAYVWTWVFLPILTLIAGVLIFIRKPWVLLFYAGATVGLLSVYYYTLLAHARYCGYLLVVLLVSYWLSGLYAEKKYDQPLLRRLGGMGQKIANPFLTVILCFHVIGAMVAYSMDSKYKFSSAQEASAYIIENKLDTLPMAGITDFVASPVATYTHKQLYYPQMRAMGSFTIWNSKRQNQMTFSEMINGIDSFMTGGRSKILFIKDKAPQLTTDGVNFFSMERGMVKSDLQMDLLKTFNAGIVTDERYFIYMVQRVDSTKVDYNNYPRVN